MRPHDQDTEGLIDRVRSGDPIALERLLCRYQTRLRTLIALHMDRRLSARFDPSDVVQSALVVAAKRMPDFIRDRPVGFYPWLRRLALERLIDFERKHLVAAGRTVRREEPRLLDRTGESNALAHCLAAGSSPAARLERTELQATMASALDSLPAADREILILRHLEGLSTAEVATVLGLTEAAVKSRHFRALERLRTLLRGQSREEPT